MKNKIIDFIYFRTISIFIKYTTLCKKIKLPNEVSQKIWFWFKESNQKLKGEYSLELDKYRWNL